MMLLPPSLQEGKDQRSRAALILHIVRESAFLEMPGKSGSSSKTAMEVSRDISSRENELIGGDPVQWK